MTHSRVVGDRYPVRPPDDCLIRPSTICALKSIIYPDHELGLSCLNMRSLFPSITDGLKANLSGGMIGFDLL